MLDVMKLALETDSTRIISLFIDTTVIHNITHHGNGPEALAELRGHEEKQFDALGSFLTALFAYPMAYFLAVKVSPRWRVTMLVVVMAPFWTSQLLRY